MEGDIILLQTPHEKLVSWLRKYKIILIALAVLVLIGSIWAMSMAQDKEKEAIVDIIEDPASVAP